MTRRALYAAALLLPLAVAAQEAQVQPQSLQSLQQRSLAATCANCHGTQGRARGDLPPLAGMPAERMLALLADFKAGKAPATVMHQIARGYADEQLRLIASYFAAQPAAPVR